MEHAHVSTRLNCLTLRLGYDGADYILYGEDSGGGGADNARRALGRISTHRSGILPMSDAGLGQLIQSAGHRKSSYTRRLTSELW